MKTTRSTKDAGEDLIDVYEVARLLRLTHRTSVSTYLRRYPDMPRPTQSGGGSRGGKWSRSRLTSWIKERFGSSS